MSYVLRVGERVTTQSGDAVTLPTEGARASIDGDTLRVLLAFVDPTDAERRAVDHGPVELGVFTDGGIIALLLRTGEPGTPAYVEAKAPLNLFHRTTHLNGFLHATSGREADLVGGSPEASFTAEFALCDADTHVVQALRSIRLPTDVTDALRAAARAQVATIRCTAEVERSTLHTLRAATVEELMTRAVERYQEADR
ncbi:MAG: hypothetical protein ABJF88_05695 [Rhodothermales bacterium]